MALFESYERRINQINAVLKQYGIKDIAECCYEKGRGLTMSLFIRANCDAIAKEYALLKR